MIQVQSAASTNTTPASTANSRPDAKEVRSMIAMIRTMETDNTRKVAQPGSASRPMHVQHLFRVRGVRANCRFYIRGCGHGASSATEIRAFAFQFGLCRR